jgi:hypothetical protein
MPPRSDLPGSRPSVGTPSYRVQPPPISRRTVYVPDADILVTRRTRVHDTFNVYYTRPVVVYRDAYSSLFWW